MSSNPADRPPVVVISAMSKVTDRLIETARLAGVGDAEAAARTLNELLDRHLRIWRLCARLGENLRADPTLVAKAVIALCGIPLRLVSQAASRRNITFSSGHGSGIRLQPDCPAMRMTSGLDRIRACASC
jgi:hypothetical protein